MDVKPVRTRYRVEVPYGTTYVIPQMCTACGAPAFGLTRKVSKSGLNVGAGVAGVSVGGTSSSLDFPVCWACREAAATQSKDDGKGCMPSLLTWIAVTAALFLVRSSLPEVWWAFAGGVVVAVIVYAVLRSRRKDRPAREVIERGRQVERSVKIIEVDDHGTLIHHKNKHVTFQFTNADVAQLFAEANHGTLSTL